MPGNDTDYAAVAEIYRNVAALEFLSVLLDRPDDELHGLPLSGVGHICKLLHEDMQRTLERL
jgi:hypothetical protein